MVLAPLHWLPVKFRVDFKVLLFVYKAIQKLAPDYICELIQPDTTVHVANPKATELSRLLHLNFGTAYLLIL